MGKKNQLLKSIGGLLSNPKEAFMKFVMGQHGRITIKVSTFGKGYALMFRELEENELPPLNAIGKPSIAEVINQLLDRQKTTLDIRTETLMNEGKKWVGILINT